MSLAERQRKFEEQELGVDPFSSEAKRMPLNKRQEQSNRDRLIKTINGLDYDKELLQPVAIDKKSVAPVR